MHKLIKLAVILPLWGVGLAAQSPSETQAFIVREFKAFDTDRTSIKDISFSDGGMVFSFVSATSSQGEHKVSLCLDGVSVFMARRVNQSGDYLYDLAAEARGRSGKLQINGNPVFGAVRLLENSSNKAKMRQLEKAFAHLKKLLHTEDSKTVF